MSKNEPKVSILIPCYNGAKYIDRCLNCCLNQTYKNIDILVINDGSVDNSLQILDEWKNKDSRIRVISQINKGLGETRNALIDNAKGEYFTFLDIDDTMPDTAISKLVSHLEDGEKDIVVGRTYLKYDAKKIMFPFFPSWWRVVNMSKGHYVKSNICTPWCSLIKTNYFKSLDIKFLPGRIFEDIGVMTFVFLNCKEFKCIGDVVYYYHRTKSNQGGTSPLSSFRCLCFKKSNDVIQQLDHVLYYLDKNNLVNNFKYRRYVNGLLFQATPSVIFLSKNLTSNKYYRKLIWQDFCNVAKKYGLNFRISKTPWKLVGYFYISTNCYKNIYGWKIKKQYIKGTCDETSKVKYKLISGLNFSDKPTKYLYLNYNLEELRMTKFTYFKNTNIVVNPKNWDEETFRIINKIVNMNNLLPFAMINPKTFDLSTFQTHDETFFGFFIDISAENSKDNILEIINQLRNVYNKNQRSTVIYLVATNEQKDLVKSLEENTEGVFYR